MKTRVSLTVIALMMATFMLAGATEVNARKVSFASSLENEMDPVMKIENWMVNSHYWNNTDAVLLSREYDNVLALESWMTDLNRWDATAMVPVENENPMQMEAWMTSPGWEIASMIPVETESTLGMEAWMTNFCTWNGNYCQTVSTEAEPKLSLESWMTNTLYWSQPENR
jgi:hypothetical protein